MIVPALGMSFLSGLFSTAVLAGLMQMFDPGITLWPWAVAVVGFSGVISGGVGFTVYQVTR